MADKKDNIPASVAAMLAEAARQAQVFRDALDNRPQSKVVPVSSEEPEIEYTPEELLQECAWEPETDIGNGRRLLMRHGKRILNVARVGWHGYDDRHWKEDEDGSVVRPLAQKTAELIDDEANLLSATEDEQKLIDEMRAARAELKKLGRPQKAWSDEQSQKYMKLVDDVERGEDAQKIVNSRKSARHRFAKSSAGTTKLNNMLTEAAPHVARMVNDMNTDLYAFNMQNGTLRFEPFDDVDPDGEATRTCWEPRLHRHNQADYISKLALVDYNPDLSAPQFEAFLKQVQPSSAIRQFLKQFMGYCLLGITTEQCLVFFYGAGRNGKSTFVDLFAEILGNYAVTLSIDSFSGEGKRSGAEATPDLARLPGARFVAASEPESGVHLKEALIKTLTGGESIPVRRLQQEFIEVIPQFKILISGNHKPVIRDNSDGIWRRVMLVPWDVQIPKHQVDRKLPDKLRNEKEGILNWMIEGAIEYLETGLNVPDEVKAATEEYREESDPIAAFLRSACNITGQDADTSSPHDICIGYANWARLEGRPEFKNSTLMRRMPEYARRQWPDESDTLRRFRKGKSGNVVYYGIHVKDEFVKPKSEDRETNPAPSDR